MKKILGAILALGFVFRVLFLGYRQLWTDELMQAIIVRAGSLDELIRNLKAGMPFPAPLDYVVQKGFVLLLGSSPWSLRLHAAILGTVSIWLFYRVSLTLFGTRVALYSAALFAFCPLHLHYSQEGRPYALLVLLTLASYYLLLCCISGKNGGKAAWVGLAVTCLLMLYTSVLGLAVLISQATALVLSAIVGGEGAETVTQRLRRSLDDKPAPPPSRDLAKPTGRQVLAYVAVFFVALGLYVPWLLSSWRAPQMVPRSELVRPGILLVALKGFGDNSYPVTGLLLLGAITGAAALRAHGYRRCLLWFLSWPLAYVLAAWVLDASSGYFFSARQLVPAVPALLLLAGYGLSHVGERLTLLDEFPYRLSSPALVYAAALLLMAGGVALGRRRKDPADWTGAAQYLRQNLRAGDALSTPAVTPLLEYLEPSLRDFRSADLDPGAGTLGADGIARRFVVCYNGMSPDPCGGFRAVAAKGGPWNHRELPGFTIFTRSSK